MVGNAPYSHAVLTGTNNFLLPVVVLLYIILSGLPECLEFPIETIGEVSVACMLSFSLKAALTSTISLHELHVDLLKFM